jgi:hypothetical protein
VRSDTNPLAAIGYAKAIGPQEMTMPTAIPALTMTPTMRSRKSHDGFAGRLLIASVPLIAAVFITSATHGGHVSVATLTQTLLQAGQAAAAAEAPSAVPTP